MAKESDEVEVVEQEEMSMASLEGDGVPVGLAITGETPDLAKELIVGPS